MKRYLLDTNSAAHCIFRRRGVHERVKRVRSGGAKVGVALPVVAELLAGAEYSASREKNLLAIKRGLGPFVVWPLTLESAEIYARTYADLRRKGQTIGAIDLMIGAIALTLGDCTVVTSDRDLSAIPGLSVENWEV